MLKKHNDTLIKAIHGQSGSGLSFFFVSQQQAIEADK